MVANGIIAGVGNNTFAPRSTTSAEEAKGYASATREQALVIAVRMVENLKGKTPDVSTTQPSQPTPGPVTPTTAPSGSIDSKPAGYWKCSYSYYSGAILFAGAAYYNFYADGTFKSWDQQAGRYLTGTYSTTGGKVSFTVTSGYVYTLSGMRADDKLSVYNGSTFEYECSSDNDGKYLKIARLGYSAGEKALSNGSVFRETNATEFDNVMKDLGL
jgi:hypothetical protein